MQEKTQLPKSSEDGGYYAILGFEYQYLESAKKILKCKDENIEHEVETMQDGVFNGEVTQFKYHKQQKPTDSGFKKAILKIVEDFKSKPNNNYKLTCFFSDTEPATKKLTIEELNRIIKPTSSKIPSKINKRISNITLDDKTSFMKKFKIEYTHDYKNEHQEIVKLIHSNFGGEIEESENNFFILAGYLRSVVINNPKNKRTCTKKQLLEHIQKNRNIIYSSELYRRLENEKYCKYIKKELFSHPNIQDLNRYFLIEVGNTNSENELKILLSGIKNFYNRAHNAHAPYIYLYPKNTHSKAISEYFAGIDGGKNLGNDGYYSIHKQFLPDVLLENCDAKIKFIELEHDLQILLTKKQKPLHIYNFYTNNEIYSELAKHYKISGEYIKIKHVNDIKNIMNT